MNSIRSRRHLRFYGLLCLISVFFFLLPVIFIYVAHPVTLLLALIFLGVGSFTVYKMIEGVPVITINSEFITFNKSVYAISDIKKIKLTGKYNWTFLKNIQGANVEAATISFVSGEKRYVLDDYYSNTAELKQFLQRVMHGKLCQEEKKLMPEKRIVLTAGRKMVFNNNLLLSFRGIILSFFIGLYAYFVCHPFGQNFLPALLLATVFLLFFFFLFSLQMYYFKISTSVFQVRNNVFFWIRKEYNLKDIQEIVFESNYKAPDALRVVLRDYRSFKFNAATLYTRTWNEMKLFLESQGIRVRDQLNDF